MSVKDRSIKRKKEGKQPLASNLPNCLLSCWDFQLQLFTNLWGESLLSERVRESALTCCAASRATLNAVSPCRQTKGRPRQWTTPHFTASTTSTQPRVSLSCYSLSYSLLWTALTHASSTQQQYRLILTHVKKRVNNLCQVTNSARAQQMLIFDGNVFLSLKGITFIWAINTALMGSSKANTLCLALKRKSIFHTSIKTVSESKQIVTAPDGSVSAGECAAK